MRPRANEPPEPEDSPLLSPRGRSRLYPVQAPDQVARNKCDWAPNPPMRWAWVVNDRSDVPVSTVKN